MPDPPARRASILLDLYTAAQLAGSLLGAELEASGLSADGFGLLSVIAVLEPVTPSALAAELGLPPTTLSASVQRLVDRGHVRRDPNPSDGRSYLIRLTDEGLGVARAGSGSVRKVVTMIDAELAPPIDDVMQTVRELNRAMRAALAARTQIAAKS